AALGDLPGCPAVTTGADLHCCVRGRDHRRVLDPLARRRSRARGARLLRPDATDADRARVAVLALGLAAVPRRAAGPARTAVRTRGASGRGRPRAAVRAAAEVAPAARGVNRRAARRARDRDDALVLRLSGLVLPLRRLRSPLARDRA